MSNSFWIDPDKESMIFLPEINININGMSVSISEIYATLLFSCFSSVKYLKNQNNPRGERTKLIKYIFIFWPEDNG